MTTITTKVFWEGDDGVRVGGTGSFGGSLGDTQGYVYKQSKFMKKWELKWAVVHEGELSFYQFPTESKPSFHCSLHQAKLVVVKQIPKNRNNNNNKNKNKNENENDETDENDEEEYYEDYNDVREKSTSLEKRMSVSDETIAQKFGDIIEVYYEKGKLIRIAISDIYQRHQWIDLLKSVCYKNMQELIFELKETVSNYKKQIEIDQQLIEESTTQSMALEQRISVLQDQLQREKLLRESALVDYEQQMKASLRESATQQANLIHKISELEEKIKKISNDFQNEQKNRKIKEQENIEIKEKLQEIENKIILDQKNVSSFQEKLESSQNQESLETIIATTLSGKIIGGTSSSSKPSSRASSRASSPLPSPSSSSSPTIASTSSSSSSSNQLISTTLLNNYNNNNYNNRLIPVSTKAGQLKKRRRKLGSSTFPWKTVWCVLTDGVLVYYNSSQEVGKVKGKQIFTGTSIFRECVWDEQTNKSKEGLVFEIIDVTGKREIDHFSTDTHEDLVEWVSSLYQNKSEFIQKQLASTKEYTEELEYKLEVKVSEVELLSNEVNRLKWQLQSSGGSSIGSSS